MDAKDWISAFDGDLKLRRHGPRQQIVAVDARQTRLDLSGVERLARSLPVLTELILSGTHFPTTVLDNFAAAALVAARSCERLAVNAAAIEASRLVEFLRGLGPLRTLDLAGTALKAGDVVEALRLHPGLSELHLGTVPPQGFEHRFLPVSNGGEVLDAVGDLRGLETLSLRGLDIADEPALLANLGQLTRLDLGETRAGDLTALALAHCPSLRELRIDRTLLGDKGLEALISHGGLTRLDLSRTRVSALGIRLLAKQRQLRHLALGGLPVTDDQSDVVSSLTGLHSLDLSATGAGARVVEALAGSPALHTLYLPTATPDAVSACLRLRVLRHLSLGVREPIWEDLAKLDALDNLAAPMDSTAHLPAFLRQLRTPSVDAQSVERLSSAICLESLSIGSGAAHFSKLHPRALPELREFLATESGLDDSALRRVLASPAIEALYVSDNPISPLGLQAIADSPFIHTLELRDVPLKERLQNPVPIRIA